MDSQLVEGDAGGREGVVVEVGRSVEPDEDAWESVPDAKSIPFNTPSNNGDPADIVGFMMRWVFQSENREGEGSEEWMGRGGGGLWKL